ncbi:MAG: hypothetical protein ACXVGG_13665 [Mycobacteriaceae bacterium]
MDQEATGGLGEAWLRFVAAHAAAHPDGPYARAGGLEFVAMLQELDELRDTP